MTAYPKHVFLRDTTTGGFIYNSFSQLATIVSNRVYGVAFYRGTTVACEDILRRIALEDREKYKLSLSHDREHLNWPLRKEVFNRLVMRVVKSQEDLHAMVRLGV